MPEGADLNPLRTPLPLPLCVVFDLGFCGVTIVVRFVGVGLRVWFGVLGLVCCLC